MQVRILPPSLLVLRTDSRERPASFHSLKLKPMFPKDEKLPQEAEGGENPPAHLPPKPPQAQPGNEVETTDDELDGGENPPASLPPKPPTP
jgi:hypothetical protein